MSIVDYFFLNSDGEVERCNVGIGMLSSTLRCPSFLFDF